MGTKFIALIAAVSALVIASPEAQGAISFTAGYWSTTFDCDDWTQSGATQPNCDDIIMADDSAYFGDARSQISLAGNYSGGGGGKGWLTRFDGGAHNTMTTPIRIDFPTGVSEFWLRFYYMIPDGQYMGNTPAHKILYLYGDYATLNLNWPYYSGGLGVEGRGNFASDINYADTRTQYAAASLGNWQAVYGNSEATGADGTWHCFEFHFKAGTTSNNGVFDMWVDGVNVVHDTGLDFGGGTGAVWTHFFLPSNHNSFMDNTDPANAIDDIAIATAAYTGFVTNSTGHATGLDMIGPIGAAPETPVHGGRLSGSLSGGGVMR